MSLLLLIAPIFAQTPEYSAELLAAAQEALAQVNDLADQASTETLYTVDSVSLVRFAGDPGDANPVIKALDAGAEVAVVYREGELVRVRVGADFGWADEKSFTDEAPAAIEPAGGLLNGLNLGGLSGGGFSGGLAPNPFGGLPGAPPAGTPPGQ
ncbi:MAG: hypothetical protein ACI9VR_001363 [Cognaticolwellia sp.]